jgi:hypothetical protein
VCFGEMRSFEGDDGSCVRYSDGSIRAKCLAFNIAWACVTWGNFRVCCCCWLNFAMHVPGCSGSGLGHAVYNPLNVTTLFLSVQSGCLDLLLKDPYNLTL